MNRYTGMVLTFLHEFIKIESEHFFFTTLARNEAVQTETKEKQGWILTADTITALLSRPRAVSWQSIEVLERWLSFLKKERSAASIDQEIKVFQKIKLVQSPFGEEKRGEEKDLHLK